MSKAKGAHKLSQLTAMFCKNAGPGRHGDGGGLYLMVDPSGARRWMQRIVIGEKRRDLGLGSYPAITLAIARNLAAKNREQVEGGVNPLEVKRRAIAEQEAIKAAQQAKAAVPSFGQVVDSYLGSKLAAFKNAKHRAQWRSTLETYAAPILRDLPVDEIDTPHILQVLEPIWLTKTETASRLRGRIEAVLRFAAVKKYRSRDNPAQWKGHLEETLPKPGKVAKPEQQPALSLADAPNWFAQLRQRDGTGARALEFLVLTAGRSGEVRGAVWSEIDLDRALWTIPAARMKAEREHRVALSPSALELLKSQPRFVGTDLVFPAHRGGQLSDMTLSAVMRRMHETSLTDDQEAAKAAGMTLAEDAGGHRDPRNRRPAVPHGMRSTFRQWAAERGFPREIAELALAHFMGSEVERAYQRSDMLERRRALMTAWADFMAGSEAANVVPLVARA